MHPGKIVNVLCVGSGHRLHIPTSGTDNPGLQNLFWWVQCCFYVKNLINDLLLCTFIYICSRRSCAERTWNKEYGTFLGSLHLMHGKGKSGLITRQGCPGERDSGNEDIFFKWNPGIKNLLFLTLYIYRTVKPPWEGGRECLGIYLWFIWAPR